MNETTLGEIKVMRQNVCSAQKQRAWEEMRKGGIKDNAPGIEKGSRRLNDA